MYNCFEFEKTKEINIYMSPELFKCCFIEKNNDIEYLSVKKSNNFGIALLTSQFICNLKDG